MKTFTTIEDQSNLTYEQVMDLSIKNEYKQHFEVEVMNLNKRRNKIKR